MSNEQPIMGQPPKDGVPATAHIHLRTTMRRKSAYVRAARRRKLTDWCFEHLDAAANYHPDTKREEI